MISLRLVLDTNIVVSAALQPYGLPRTVLVVATTKPALLYISGEILAEYREALARPEFRIHRGLQHQVLQLIQNRARRVTLSRKLDVTSDPDDNMFLECADAARADYLVTGNVRHFPKFWKRTKIITARDFLALTAPHLFG